MLSLRNVTLARGSQPLISGASLSLQLGDRVGLVGPNGAGKSTLFAALLGELAAQQGELEIPSSWRMAHVAQEVLPSDKSLLDYAIDGHTQLRETEQQLQEAEDAHDGERIAQLHGQLADLGAYEVRSKAASILHGLGFAIEQQSQPVSQLSGGWRMRVNLAQALLAPSQVLLLDEPTNHLDLDAIVWLERWLARYDGLLVIISHDRDFLDDVINTILHIDQGKLQRYSGNYSSFETQRAERMALQQSAYAKQQDKIAHLQRFIDRFKAKATKAKQAQSRVKQLEKMETLAPVRLQGATEFEFAQPPVMGDPLVSAEEMQVGYDSAAPLQRDVKLSLRPGMRIGLLGVNGAGKTTLVKTLVGQLPKLSGILTMSKNLRVGYFAQQQVEQLDFSVSPLTHFTRLEPTTREQELRDYLGSFGFAGEDATRAVGPMSGGEKARLALSLIVRQKPNLLLLDEPTNHLDLGMREALAYALQSFEGALLLVSHDRYLLRAATDELWLVHGGGVQPFDGSLEDYRDWLLQNKFSAKVTAEKTAAPTVTKDNPVAAQKVDKKAAAQERQRLADLRRPIQKKITQLEQEVQTLSAQKAQLEQQLADPVLAADGERFANVMKEWTDTERRLARAENAWMEQAQLLEEIV